jgi:hypothetical protein
MKKRKKNWELTPQERAEKTQPEVFKATPQRQIASLRQELEWHRQESSKLRGEARAYAHLKKQTVMILEEGQDPVVLRGDELDAWVVKSMQRAVEARSVAWKFWQPSVQPTAVFFDEVVHDT